MLRVLKVMFSASFLVTVLLLQTACGVQFENTRLDHYNKAGVSAEQRKNDLHECEHKTYALSGAVAKSSHLQHTRTLQCLKSRGYSDQRQYN